MNSGLKILIVDDNENLLETLILVFESEGYEQVSGAPDGEDALIQIRKNDFDIVFMDIRMPKINGIDVTKKIKAINPHVKVVLMTAYSSKSLIDQAYKEGAYLVLKKPIQPAEFFDILKKI